MKNKKVIISIIAVVVIAIASLGAYLYFFKEDKDTTLTILEKQWIESNKSKMIDLAILNNIPLFNYLGEGIVFDFVNDLENNTGLKFNKVPYSLNTETTSDYAFKIVNKASDKDILVYQDNYVLLTIKDQKYNSLSDLGKMTIGVMSSELTEVSSYLADCKECTFKSYTNIDTMLTDIKNSTETDAIIDGVVLLKNAYMDKMLGTDKINIAYNITGMTRDYVLTLGNVDRLNTIIKKYYQKWHDENYNTKYEDHFLTSYFSFNAVDEKEQVNARSKRYSYGFINNAPYDVLTNTRYIGINSQLLQKFSELSNMEIDYKSYDNSSDLKNAFNANKIDFIFNNLSDTTYDMDIYKTISSYKEDIVIMVKWNNNLVVDNVTSLKNKTVGVVENTALGTYLKDKGVKLHNYGNIGQLVNGDTDILAMDLLSYNYYIKNNLSDYRFAYHFTMNHDYNFLMRDINDNKIFNNFFNFYLQFINEGIYINNGLYQLTSIAQKPLIVRDIIIYGSFIIALVIVVLFARMFIKKRKQAIKVNYKKVDKLRYIDTMTSLKNRNYFNDNIEAWDESEVYPQAIVIIDLNNIAYINDNYGHNEGDKVIIEAANILIRNQIGNTEIMRTNGNEFLVYMVGYDEKQVLAYIRKMNKELKNLSHNFGAAAGYSMIMDAIKTIDDAVNEATSDMRTNKEAANNEKQS